MKALASKLVRAGYMLSKGDLTALGERAKRGLYLGERAVGLRRDLTLPFVQPKAKIPITVRKISTKDVSKIFEKRRSNLEKSEIIELGYRYRLLKSGIQTCYVAIDDVNEEPCYIQWVINSKYNDKVQDFFGAGYFPILKQDEALLEGAYTFSQYRGQGIMASAMARIAEHATELGCCHVITFVAHDNMASLRGCKKAGFSPYTYRSVTRALYGLIDKVTFMKVPALTTSEI